MMKQTIYTLFLLLFLSKVILAQAEVNYICPPCNSSCDTLRYDGPGTCQHCGMELLIGNHQEAETPQKIAFYLQNGVEVLDFAGPMEVFSYAGFEVFTVSKTTEPIVSQGILKIIPDYSLEDAPPADLLAFFGGNGRASFADPAIQHWIKEQTDIDYYFSVCTGAFALAETHLLDNLTATTFHNALDDLEQDFPAVKVVRNARYVDNGKVITTAGISAGIDGALHLVAKLKGFNTARRVAYHMEYDHWKPGDGLLLNDDNPYELAMNIPQIDSYLGTYEFYDQQQISIAINPQDQSLYATVGGMNYPLFYLETDLFQDIGNEQVRFQRDAQGQITGYTTTEKPDQFLRKLE